MMLAVDLRMHGYRLSDFEDAMPSAMTAPQLRATLITDHHPPYTPRIPPIGREAGTQARQCNALYLDDSDDLSLAWMNIANNGNNQTAAGSSTTVGGNLRTGNNLSAVANVTLFDVNGASLDHVSVAQDLRRATDGGKPHGALTRIRSTS
jgi:hypothetical protein